MATLNLESSSSATSAAASLGISRFQHTPYYCEENVYLLCKKLCEDGTAKPDASDLFVVFISNEKNQIPLWHQRASHRADGVTLWDYHVICVQRRKENSLPDLVWDLDSSLPFPSPLATYVAETIRPSFQLFSEFQRVFRIVHAPIFLKSFASDRRHMKDSSGNWVATPPSYEVIAAEDGTAHNLNEYLAMSSLDVTKSIGDDTVDVVLTEKLGVLVGESRLEEFFSQIPL
ncbi:amino-terminal glutamine amidohydrolase [Perilla frutescens var. hirtella]|uniref:Protein N-terminal glutamine amidohydrolase n=1 Tax=Perilla frutescens var. hirtella TaxID=608512 RepID=A0AAD4J3D9_PERFH|nr:amino-terminal glutamine amidohydrolase [Perilla frutescens var. frutescens]KAH6793860.1 amino-terminal glutamine amidohydrolase [Perilla frutescens var. hirtella]KAH6826131.1 amino-terminal glutamine amidohydrolase [Perilla frutescens var. hirtella]